MKPFPQTNSNKAAERRDEPLSAPADKPIVVIEPGKSWVSLNLSDLWGYRELIYFLIWRDVKVRYKQTLLGAAWAVIQPLVNMLIFTVLFGKLVKIPSDSVPYPIFVYAGLLPWTFFSNAVTGSGNSLIGNANLITKIYFPRMIIPTSAVGAGLVDFIIAFILLAGLMVYYGIALTWNILLLPAMILLTTLLALGIGMWMAAMNVKYRDVRYALPFVIQAWMFLTPIIYPSSLIPESWRWTLKLNPLAGIIEGYRASLCTLPVDWAALAVSAFATLAILLFSSYTFRRMEKDFAEFV